MERIGIFGYWSNNGLGIIAKDLYNLLKDKYDIRVLVRDTPNHQVKMEDFITMESQSNVANWAIEEKIDKLISLQFIERDFQFLNRRNIPVELIPMGEWVEKKNIMDMANFTKIFPTCEFDEALCYFLKRHLKSNHFNLSKTFNADVKKFFYVPPIDELLKENIDIDENITFLLDLGMGGIWDRKNTDFILHAFINAARQRDDLKMLVKTQRYDEFWHPYVREMFDHKSVVRIHKNLEQDKLTSVRKMCQVNVSAQAFGGPDLVHFETMPLGMGQLIMDNPIFSEFPEDVVFKYKCKYVIDMGNNFVKKFHPDLGDFTEKILNLDLKEIKKRRNTNKEWVKDRRKECVDFIRREM